MMLQEELASDARAVAAAFDAMRDYIVAIDLAGLIDPEAAAVMTRNLRDMRDATAKIHERAASWVGSYERRYGDLMERLVGSPGGRNRTIH